jgi:hypothetical protein
MSDIVIVLWVIATELFVLLLLHGGLVFGVLERKDREHGN